MNCETYRQHLKFSRKSGMVAPCIHIPKVNLELKFALVCYDVESVFFNVRLRTLKDGDN